MEFDVTPVFPTLIGRFRVPDADAMNQDLQALILAEEEKYASLGRSNIGGWHSRTDFLNRRDPAVSALTTWLTWALRRMIDASAGANTFQGTLSVSAGRLCAARVPIMRRTRIRTAHGPGCIMWIPERRVRSSRSTVFWSSSIRGRAWRP
jgi:hypothetical protein